MSKEAWQKFFELTEPPHQVGDLLTNIQHTVDHTINQGETTAINAVVGLIAKAFGKKAGAGAGTILRVLFAFSGPAEAEASIDIAVEMVQASAKAGRDTAAGHPDRAAADLAGGISQSIFLQAPFGPLMEALFFDGAKNPVTGRAYTPDESHQKWLDVNAEIARADPFFALRLSIASESILLGGPTPSGVCGLLQASKIAVGILAAEIAQAQNPRVDKMRFAATVEDICDMLCGLILDIADVAESIQRLSTRHQSLTTEQAMEAAALATMIVAALSKGQIGPALDDVHLLAGFFYAVSQPPPKPVTIAAQVL